MKFLFKKTVLTVVAAFVLVAAIVLIINSKPTLVLSDKDTGKVFASFDFDYGDTFSISFIHSVNQSEVVDYFKRGKQNKLICRFCQKIFF